MPSYILAITNSYKSVWKLFGTANQLIAAIALLTASFYLARARKSKTIAFIPAVFMLATAVAALIWEMFNPGSGFFTGPNRELFLGIISAILLVLTLMAVVRGLRAMRNHRTDRETE